MGPGCGEMPSGMQSQGMKKNDIESVRRILRTRDPEDPLRRLIIRISLQKKRYSISMANSAPPGAPSADRLNRKRFLRRQLAQAAAKLTGSSRPPIPKDVLAFRYAPHPVLDALLPKRSGLWKPILRRDRKAGPSTAAISQLSFLDDPAGTLGCLSEIIRLETFALGARLDFDFEYVEDIGPFLLMAEFWPHFAPVFNSGGTMYPPVQKVIAAVGLSHSLGMAFPGLKNLKDVWALPVQRRRETGRSRSSDRYLEPQTAEIAADRLVAEIDVWLNAAGTNAALTSMGRSNITSLVTELLDNAERHSSYEDRDGGWSLAAFMARRMIDGEVRYMCHFAIISIGSTIFESMEATAPAELREKIEDFVTAMRMSKARQSRATLVTLAALQDGVTRDERAFREGSGGYGFMHFVDSVNILGLSNRPELAPKIAILSGSSCIRMRHPYISGKRRGDEVARKLFFNPSNTLGEPADEAFVYDLPVHLPGTVISVGFTLDQDFYRTILNGNDPTE